MDEETRTKIINLGSLLYPAEKCANILMLTGAKRAQFLKDFLNPSSEVAQCYQIGIDLADFEIDSKLLQLAKSGDLKAIQKLEFRKKTINAKSR